MIFQLGFGNSAQNSLDYSMKQLIDMQKKKRDENQHVRSTLRLYELVEFVKSTPLPVRNADGWERRRDEYVRTLETADLSTPAGLSMAVNAVNKLAIEVPNDKKFFSKQDIKDAGQYWVALSLKMLRLASELRAGNDVHHVFVEQGMCTGDVCTLYRHAADPKAQGNDLKLDVKNGIIYGGVSASESLSITVRTYGLKGADGSMAKAGEQQRFGQPAPAGETGKYTFDAKKGSAAESTLVGITAKAFSQYLIDNGYELPSGITVGEMAGRFIKAGIEHLPVFALAIKDAEIDGKPAGNNYYSIRLRNGANVVTEIPGNTINDKILIELALKLGCKLTGKEAANVSTADKKIEPPKMVDAVVSRQENIIQPEERLALVGRMVENTTKIYLALEENDAKKAAKRLMKTIPPDLMKQIARLSFENFVQNATFIKQIVEPIQEGEKEAGSITMKTYLAYVEGIVDKGSTPFGKPLNDSEMN